MENIKKHLMQLPLGICAGVSIGLGGFLFTVISFALPNIYGKVLGSIAFAIGLFLVCTFYFSLYTGKVGIAIENKGPKDAIIDLPIMLLGNLGGAVGFGYLMHLFFQNTDMMATFTKIALSRAKDFTGNATFEMYLTTFLAAFLCGLCVYLAVKCFGKRRLKPLGIIELVFFVFTFVYCGFEHCIANMFYFSQANAWSWNAVVNIIIVVIGNSVGTLPGIALWKIAGDK